MVPKLVDNKRKHMELALSAAQYDGVLLNDAKEDTILRKEMIKVMKTSSESFVGSCERLSDSMIHISNSLSRSMEMLAQSYSAPHHIPQHQAFNFPNQYQQQSYQEMLYQNQERQHFKNSTLSAESPRPVHNGVMKE